MKNYLKKLWQYGAWLRTFSQLDNMAISICRFTPIFSFCRFTPIFILAVWLVALDFFPVRFIMLLPFVDLPLCFLIVDLPLCFFLPNLSELSKTCCHASLTASRSRCYLFFLKLLLFIILFSIYIFIYLFIQFIQLFFDLFF